MARSIQRQVLQPPPVHLALLASLALNCQINPASSFDRKHYFYPDLPAGFQITQKYSPLAKDGLLRVRLNTGKGGAGKKKKGKQGEQEFVDVRIEQIQLEQDTAKSFHDPSLSPPGTLLDLTRAGTALIEIVTAPDLSSSEEAGAFVRALQAILRHTGVSGGNMERGELRCDVNVSVARVGEEEGKGVRCEIKNLNGVRFVQGAIEAEIARQILAYESNEEVQQATRGYDALAHRTFHLRGKEQGADYRFMPDPELGVVRVTEDQLTHLRSTLPELPDAAYVRLQSQYGLSARDAGILVALGEGGGAAGGEGEAGAEGEGAGEGEVAIGVRWFEEVVEAPGEGMGGKDRVKGAANWLIHELLGQLSKAQLTLASCPVKPTELAEVVDAVKGGRITGTNAKQLLRDYLSSPTQSTSFSSFLAPHLSSPSASASSSSPDSDLSDLCARVIEALPQEAAKVRSGQVKVLMRMVGEAMKLSGGKADARKVREGLERMLREQEGGEKQ
ncbi:hypothetical protein JCM10213v2_001325 [Rhodosporidiobolus nylandii]